MGRAIRCILRGRVAQLPVRIAALSVVLIAANFGAWAWTLLAFHDYPVLLGTALLAYGLGLRHAMDADHIAAIDNVTRKLMQEGKRPVTVGFFFSLGHSTVVVLASIAIAATALSFRGRLAAFQQIGTLLGTLVSAAFLLAIAVANFVVLIAVYRTFRRVIAGEQRVDNDLSGLLAGGGPLTRLVRPMFRMVRRNWHMYPLGFLFGLGFDTATEVGLLGISAGQIAHGMPIRSMLVFPALFTAGMSLVDTADGILMLGVYGWAFVMPVRKLYYNMTITLVSVLVALSVGTIETLGLFARRFALSGGLWDWIGALNDNFGSLGYLIVGLFILTWIVSSVAYRARGYHRLELRD